MRRMGLKDYTLHVGDAASPEVVLDAVRSWPDLPSEKCYMVEDVRDTDPFPGFGTVVDARLTPRELTGLQTWLRRALAVKVETEDFLDPPTVSDPDQLHC